jgi:hypothetical protein
VMTAFHRGIWIAIGLLCLAAGVAGLVAGLGYLGAELQRTGLPGLMASRLQLPGPRTLLAGVLGGLVLLILGLLLLRAALRLPRAPSPPDVRLRSQSEDRGAIRLRSGALRRALERDLERLPGVEAASVVLTDFQTTDELQIRLDLDGYSQLPDIRERLDRALKRLTTTVGSSPSGVEVLVRLREPRQRLLATESIADGRT